MAGRERAAFPCLPHEVPPLTHIHVTHSSHSSNAIGTACTDCYDCPPAAHEVPVYAFFVASTSLYADALYVLLLLLLLQASAMWPPSTLTLT
jgi:hypothetical protein